MSDNRPAGIQPASGHQGIPPVPPPAGPFPPVLHIASHGPARWPMFIMLLIALIAVAAAAAAWLRPIPGAHALTSPPPSFSQQRVAGAKSRVCAGYGKIQHALDANSTQNGGDPAAQRGAGVNTRQIYVAGSAYLLTVLADEPATPSDLAAAAPSSPGCSRFSRLTAWPPILVFRRITSRTKLCQQSSSCANEASGRISPWVNDRR
jgi:hypothetical protein